MTDEEFVRHMDQIDRDLAEKGVPAAFRPFHVIFGLTGAREIPVPTPPRDPSLSEYEGANLQWSIFEWYESKYKEQVKVRDFGRRLLLIRGEPFQVRLPIVFNATKDVPAREHIEALSDELWDGLLPEEKGRIQSSFNIMFRQASDLALLGVKAKELPVNNSDLVVDLVHRGRTDLGTAVTAFNRSDPHASVWPMQQAVEKYLKAFLSAKDSQIDEEALKSDYGHNIERLLRGMPFHQ